MPKWRSRIGVEGVEKLLGQVLRTAMHQQALKPAEIVVVNVDTTVQEKAIAFPQEVEVLIAGTCQRTSVLKHLLKRRSTIEPVIRYSKQDHALKRNYLRGKTGDRINALLAGCGFNLRKLFRFFMTAPLIRANT